MPASITDRGVTLFNHQSTANTTRQMYIEHKAHRPTRRMLTDKFSSGIFCPDQPTTLSALGVGRDEREEPCMYFIKTI